MISTIRQLLKNQWFHRVLLLLFLTTYFVCTVWILDHFDIGCVFRYVLGLPCPGCGITRALKAVLRGDFFAAWAYNPLVFALPYVMAFVLFDFKNQKLHKTVLGVIGVVALIHWSISVAQTLDVI